MAEHPAKLDYFGVEVVASFVAASVGDAALLFTFPAILIFPIGLPIAAVGIGIHWFCGGLILVFLWSKLGLSGDLKEAALAATVGVGGEAALKGGAKGVGKALDISAPLRYGSSAFLMYSIFWFIPLPNPAILLTGVLVAVFLHNKLIDIVVTQLAIVAVGVVTGGAGFAAEGAVVGAEGGALAAEGAATAAEAGAAVGEAAEGVATAGRAAGTVGRATRGAGRAAKGTEGATGEAGGGGAAKEIPRGALGEQETPFEEMEEAFTKTPEDEFRKTTEEEEPRVAKEKEKSDNKGEQPEGREDGSGDEGGESADRGEDISDNLDDILDSSTNEEDDEDDDQEPPPEAAESNEPPTKNHEDLPAAA